MTENTDGLAGTQPRARAAFELDMAGIASVPGIESGADYVALVSGQFEQVRRMAQNWETYSSGIEAIRQNARLSEEERLDGAADLFEAAQAAHEQLIRELEAKRAERLEDIDSLLFGAPTPESGLSMDRAAAEAARNGFRQTMLGLRGADEAQLSEAVEMAGLTGDRTLLRAARAVAQHKGFEGVVERSILQYGSDHERSRYVEKLATPNDSNLSVITRAFAPYAVFPTQLTPDLAARQRAAQEDQAREARRRGIRR